MSRAENAIFTNMCMISGPDGRILVLDRRNPDWPGVTFPGGHVEKDESFVDSVIREVREETGLTIENPVLCGIKQFRTDKNERYVVLFYRANRFSGTLRSSSEGEVFWIRREELTDYKLSIDFPDMVQVMESESLSEFYYYQENGNWKYRLL